MELIINWEILNTASLAFCHFQEMVGVMVITGIAIYKNSLGEEVTKINGKRRI